MVYRKGKVAVATLKDVAKLACVDVSTVSRALNNTSYVHPDTRARIMEAVKKLGYQPNLLAKGLRQGRRSTLGLVIPSIKLTIFGEIAQGIEMEARKLGYGVMICNTQDEPEQEAQCLNRLRNGFVDGIIIASTGRNGRLIRDIQASGISILQLVRSQDKSISSVVADYFSCAYQGVNYLISKGCRNIGLINGNMELNPYYERYRGYREAMKQAGLPEYVAKPRKSHYNHYLDGFEGANYLLAQNPNIDGLLAAVDMQGIGALRALKERGVKVPDQVKVMSLTGHSIGGMLEKSMTSIEMPALEIGIKATQLIVADIEAPADNKPEVQHVVFKTSLVVRETT